MKTMIRKLSAMVLTAVMAISMTAGVVFAEEEADAMATSTTDSHPVHSMEEFRQAVEEAPDGVRTTITLSGNITDVTTSQIVTIPSGKEIVLDMGGYAITVDPSFVGRPIVNEGSLTVTGNGVIDSSNSEFGGYGAINNFGNLLIENGTYIGHICADGAAVYNRAGGIAVIKDGTFRGCGAVNNAGTMTIDGGTFETDSCNRVTDSKGGQGHWSYCVKSEGELYFNNGTVTGVQGALAFFGGYGEVHGGTFETVGCEHGENGEYSFYALYIAGENDTVEAHIYGGNFTSAYRVAVLCGNDNTGGDGGINAKATANIHGGTFTGGSSVNGQALQAGSNTGDPKITGGVFSSDVSDYVPDGIDIKEDEDGNFIVVDPTPAPTPTPDDKPDRDNDDSDYYGVEKWNEVKRQIADADEGDTIKVSATGLPHFPSSVARELKGRDITLEIRKNGVTYKVNGLEIGAVDKIWYEFENIEEQLLTAEPEDKADEKPQGGDTVKENPATGR